MKHLLNPHLLQFLPDEPGVPDTFAPEALVSPRRFGLTFKHIYAQHFLLRGKSAYPERQYREHIQCITHGACKEDDGSKTSLDDYVAAFNALLVSMHDHGFTQWHPVPVDALNTPLDGAHRTAAALALNLPVPVVRFSHEGPAYTSAVYSGMDCARAAVEYCKLRPSARIMVLFGENTRWSVAPVYMTEFELPSVVAQDNLITELYLGEEWLGDSATGFRGAAPKARPCFARGCKVRVLLVDMPQADVIRAKEAMRAGSVRDCVHATDTQSETIRVARVLFSATSRAFLARPHKHMPGLHRLLNNYQAAISGLDQDLLCIDGSAVMARYGLREPADLDFVHAITVPTSASVSSHNEYSALYPFDKDELIWNPVDHFWSHGFKYATLDRVRQAKTAIVDEKNKRDLGLMEGL